MHVQVEPDVTVQSFAQFLTELKARNHRVLQDMLSETSITRDSITTSNLELTDFKRHSTGISQQMQAQLTDLREKLTAAFSEITALVRQKTQADQEMMQDVNNLQTNLAAKTSELEALKRSYAQAHSQLQSCLIQIQNHLHVTQGEVATAKASCERVHRDTTHRFAEIDAGLRSIEDELTAGNAENRNQMLQLQEEIARLHESITSLGGKFAEQKRQTTATHNKFQSQVWSIEEGSKRQTEPLASAAGSRQQSYKPDSAHGGDVAPVMLGGYAPSAMAAGVVTASQSSLQGFAGPTLRAGSMAVPNLTSPRRPQHLQPPQHVVGGTVNRGPVVMGQAQPPLYRFRT